MAEASYRLSPLAVADLERIWSWTARRWSTEQAESYHAGLVAAFDGLSRGRKEGRAVDVRGGYFKYAVGSHLIFYRLSAIGVDVIRILHQRMDVERHL
ncbi:type II toxin-antitoxin system RelE/ParE family toxin [Bosea sp. NPDC055353]